MGVGVIGPQGVTVITPSAREKLSKIGQIVAGDSSTGFAAFGLPKNAFIAGVYVISMGANTTQTIEAGFASGDDEILTAYAPDDTGFVAAGAAAGSAVGTLLDADKTVWLKASAALTSTVYVQVDYWVVPVGQSY